MSKVVRQPTKWNWGTSLFVFIFVYCEFQSCFSVRHFTNWIGIDRMSDGTLTVIYMFILHGIFRPHLSFFLKVYVYEDLVHFNFGCTFLCFLNFDWCHPSCPLIICTAWQPFFKLRVHLYADLLGLSWFRLAFRLIESNFLMNKPEFPQVQAAWEEMNDNLFEDLDSNRMAADPKNDDLMGLLAAPFNTKYNAIEKLVSIRFL